MAENVAIPTIDLSPFFTDGDEIGKVNVMNSITKACSNYGFFQIVNHGVPLDVMNRALSLSKTFFAYPDEEKQKSSPGLSSPLPAGYSKQPENSADKNEYLLMFSPSSSFNVLPSNPCDFKYARLYLIFLSLMCIELNVKGNN